MRYWIALFFIFCIHGSLFAEDQAGEAIELLVEPALNAVGTVLGTILNPSKGIEIQAGPPQWRLGLMYGTPNRRQDEFYGVIQFGYVNLSEFSKYDYEGQLGFGLCAGLKHWWDSSGNGVYVGARLDFMQNDLTWEIKGQGQLGNVFFFASEPSLQLGWRGYYNHGRNFYEIFGLAGYGFSGLGHDVISDQGAVARAGALLGWK